MAFFSFISLTGGVFLIEQVYNIGCVFAVFKINEGHGEGIVIIVMLL